LRALLSLVRSGIFWAMVIVLLLAVRPMRGESAEEAPTLSGIAHVAIRVSGLARSRAFYEKLGFEEAFSMEQGGAPTEAFLKINDRQFIELYPQREPSQAIGFMHVCFESTDIEKLNGKYLSRGLAPTPVKKAGAGTRSSRCRDRRVRISNTRNTCRGRSTRTILGCTWAQTEFLNS
jgi:hypothetical protein